MRSVIAGLSALALATPAAARERTPSPPIDGADAARMLQDPAAQAALARAMLAMSDALMAIRVGPLARYADPHAHVRPDDTLGDLQERHDPGYRRRLYDGTRAGVAEVGRMTGDMAAMAAELGAAAARMRHAVDTAGDADDETEQADRPDDLPPPPDDERGA